MKLGGFVIHGNAAETLGRCLDGLKAVCDEVVAVDSGSSDGSAALVDAAGVRAVSHPWRGYGSARARAAKELAGCDYVFFLDADEWLGDGTAQGIRQWKASAASQPVYRLTRRDWAMLPNRSFVFRSERRSRLVRYDVASWTEEMIVHEAVPSSGRSDLDLIIEHRFATDVIERREKNDLYALLWALRAQRERRRSKWTAPQRVSHFLRNAFTKGAAFRGGMDGVRLSWHVAAYHQSKYEFLNRVLAGEFDSLVSLFDEGRLEELFVRATDVVASSKPAASKRLIDSGVDEPE